MTPTVDADRLARELAELAAFSTQPAPAVTRVVFSDVDLQARAYISGLCREAGLEVRTDPVGNLFARWCGTDPAAAPVATGSHIDAIPNAGRFDGTVGVLGGLAAIRALQSASVRPRRSIELILFTSEEPTRFGLGCLGSRLLCGSLAPQDAARLTDADGASLETVRAAAGFDGALADVRLGEGAYAAFVELHIEQGPLLERHGEDIGLVEAIAAPASLRVRVDGEGGHAGAVLMADRRDAFTAAAEVALAVEAAARGSGSTDTVGTVGVCQVFPGAVNSVPSHTRLEIDIRDIDLARRDRVIGQVTTACAAIAERRGVRIDIAPINTDPPATCAPPIVEAAANACARRGFASRRMISRAYHDALFMARVAPTGMIFIPCRDGVSHRPDEYASAEAIARGSAVLADVLAHLAT